MLLKMLNDLKCENCNRMALDFDREDTISFYSKLKIINEDNKFQIIEEALSEYLIFVCKACGERFKYTYKDFEEAIRKNLTEIVVAMILREDIIQKSVFSVNDNVYIYCGKCRGLNGHGACPSRVYKNCELKRLPYV